MKDRTELDCISGVRSNFATNCKKSSACDSALLSQKPRDEVEANLTELAGKTVAVSANIFSTWNALEQKFQAVILYVGKEKAGGHEKETVLLRNNNSCQALAKRHKLALTCLFCCSGSSSANNFFFKNLISFRVFYRQLNYETKRANRNTESFFVVMNSMHRCPDITVHSETWLAEKTDQCPSFNYLNVLWPKTKFLSLMSVVET